MPVRHFDTIIVGGGAMGAATASQLTGRGQSVLVLDRFRPPHRLGSSHGETRVIREAYFEHPSYIPLLRRAYELWHALEKQTGQRLLTITGGLTIGPEKGVVFPGARASAEQHGLPHEILRASEVSERFPALQVPEELLAVYEPRAGMLIVEGCIAAFQQVARANGTTQQFDEPVLAWSADISGASVTTHRGSYSCDNLVISAGAWLPLLVPGLAKALRIERQVLYWFQPTTQREACEPDALPVHVVEYGPDQYYYALPNAGDGVKAALHHQGITTSADDVDREVNDTERQAMAALARRFLPPLAAAPHRSEVCLYTNTADGHFLIDRHPAHDNVFIVSPCSGHGFKFASVIGEVVADLVTTGVSRFDLSLFGAARMNWT